MSGILSSLPGTSPDFRLLPQLFPTEDVFSSRVRCLELHRSTVCLSPLQVQVFLLLLRNTVLPQIRACCALQPARCGVCTCMEHPAEAEAGDAGVGEGVGCLTAPRWKLSVSFTKPAPRNEAVAEACWAEELL